MKKRERKGIIHKHKKPETKTALKEASYERKFLLYIAYSHPFLLVITHCCLMEAKRSLKERLGASAREMISTTL